MILLAQLGPFIEDHWHIVLIAAVFFAVQLFLCSRLMRRIKAQRRMLATLQANLAEGGDGRTAAGGKEVAFPWLHWVTGVFPGGSKTPGNYTRDDVLQELDTRIAGSSDYMLLQRLGVVAPLLGVILTVAGFAWLEVPEETESLGDILFAVMPLVAGVGAGAILAFINQFLLHLAGNSAEALRIAARNWFDAAIWSGIGLDTQAATIKAIHAIESMADSIASSVAQHDASTERLVATTASMQQAGAALEAAAGAFGDQMNGIPAALTSLHETTASTAEALQQLIPVGKRAIAGLDVSVSAFRTAVEDEFVAAASLHHQVVERVGESVVRLDESTEYLRGGAEELKTTAQSQQEAFVAMNKTLHDRLVPAHETLFAGVGELTEEMTAFRTAVESLSGNVTTIAAEFAGAAGQLEPAIQSFKSAVDGQFSDSTSRHAANLTMLNESVDAIRQSADTLATGARVLESMMSEQADLQRELAPTRELIQQTVAKMGAVGDALHRSLDEVSPGQRTLREASDSFADSAAQLSIFVESLVPVAGQLRDLDATLARLKGTVETIQDFSKLDLDVEQLAGILAQAATVAEAISELPDQVREILEELVAAHHDGQSKAPVMGWLRSRP